MVSLTSLQLSCVDTKEKQNLYVPSFSFSVRVHESVLVYSSVLYPPQDNPYGIHGMGGGLQNFQMESMEWGMDSILFPWNGGWTPYFFKMDSMNWGMDSRLFKDGIHEMGDGFHGMVDGLHTF